MCVCVVCGGTEKGEWGMKSVGVAPTLPAQERRKAPAWGQGCAGLQAGLAAPGLCSAPLPGAPAAS